MSEPITAHGSTDATDSSKLFTTAIRTVALSMIVILTFSMLMAPAAAATGDPTSVETSDSEFCDNAIMTTITSAISFFTVLGPTAGTLMAVWNMNKAASSNQKQKKKEAKENIKDNLKYGFGAGAITALLGLVTSWGPFAVCGGF